VSDRREDDARLRALERALGRLVAPASSGEISLRVEASGDPAAPRVRLHVTGCTDCRGTEAEIAGLLRGQPIEWEIVWH
jgi:hypothetical protein